MVKGVIKIAQEKIDAIKEWRVPTNRREVQAFLGFGNFHRRFIEKYSSIVSPLTELTKKDAPFKWTEKCQEAFGKLK